MSILNCVKKGLTLEYLTKPHQTLMHSDEYTAKLHEILESSLKEAFSLSEQYVQQSHLDFMTLFILALMASKNVQYQSIAAHKYQIEVYMKGRNKAELRNVYIFKQTLHIGIKRQKESTKRKRKAFLAVVTNASQAGILSVYKNRWSIEILFQSLKRRGFDIQSTHLSDPIRLRKLFALVAMAFITAFTAGLAINNYSPLLSKITGIKKIAFLEKEKTF